MENQKKLKIIKMKQMTNLLRLNNFQKVIFVLLRCSLKKNNLRIKINHNIMSKFNNNHLVIIQAKIITRQQNFKIIINNFLSNKKT